MNRYDHLTAYLVENQDKFYRLAYSYVRNRCDAMDAVQNAVYKALKNIHTLRNENAIRTWFYAILVNESLSILKDKKRHPFLQNENPAELIYIEERFELQDEMHEKISQLEEPEQSIIRLRFFEEMTLNEIAEVLSMNTNTVKSKLYRGLKKLKLIIEEGDMT